MLLDNVSALHGIVVLLPVHYWLRWTQLFQGGGGAGIIAGLAAQLAAVVVALTPAAVILSRRDPAA